MRYAVGLVAVIACGRLDFTPLGSRDALGEAAMRTPPAFVQAADTSQTATTFAVAYQQPVTAGDLLIVTLGSYTAALATLGDSSTNAFTLLPEVVSSQTSPLYVAYAFANASGSDVVTATLDGSDFAGLRVHEYSGVSGFDASASSFGSATGVDSITVELATATDQELVFAYAISQDSTASAGTGFTARSVITGDVTEDAIEAIAGEHAITATDASSPWAILALAFAGR